MSKDIYCFALLQQYFFYYECNEVISYHLDSLVILALLRASRLSSSEWRPVIRIKRFALLQQGRLCCTPYSSLVSQRSVWYTPSNKVHKHMGCICFTEPMSF